MGIDRMRRRGPAAVAAAVLLVALAGCQGPEPAGSWRARPVASPSASPSASPTPPPPPPEITLAFAGDVHFTGRTRELLDEPRNAIGPFARVLRDADFAMVNLESAVTTRGTPQPKGFHFRAPASAYDALQAAGVDAVSLANNHTLDFGQRGFADTLGAAEEAGMPYVGAGWDAAHANRPYLTTVGDGVRVAVLGFSQVRELSDSWRATGSRPGIAMAFEPDRERVAAAVERADGASNLVIVYLHWGAEGSNCPTGEMRRYAELLARAGADIVVGTHAHVLLADRWLDDTYIHWGLGNFVWYSESHSTGTGVLRVTVRDAAAGGDAEVVGTEFLPGRVSGTGQPVPVDGAERELIEQRIAGAGRCA